MDGLRAQTLPNTLDVLALSDSLSAVRLSSGAIMTDPIKDQQTGQKAADFLSLTAGTYATGLYSGTAGSTLTQVTTLATDVPGFFVNAGQLGGIDSIMFRFRMSDQNGTKSYLGGYVGVGIDLGGQAGISGDGKPDLFVVVKSTGATPSLIFETAGTGANTAPNNTTAAAYTTTANTSLTVGTTFSYAQSAGPTYSESATAAKNYDLTFAISWSTLTTAIVNLGNVNGKNFANFGNVGANTEMSFFFFTSQQANAYNQDIGGGNIASTATATWTSLGAFSTPITGDGRRPYIPEFGTIAQTGLLLLVGGGLALWRRRRAVIQGRARG